MSLALSSNETQSILNLPGQYSPLKLVSNDKTSPIRVRRMITQFSYSELARTGVIPNLAASTPSIATKRYPPWLYQLKHKYENIFADFGLFIEEIIYTAIINGRMNYAEIWSRVSTIPVPSELAANQNSFVGGIIGWVRSVFAEHKVEHNTELTHRNIQGHPDLFSRTESGTWILDVKTSSSFKSIVRSRVNNSGEEAYLQILAYCTLARAIGHINNFIGILLPLQRQIFWYDVTNWNDSFYRNLLIREAEWVIRDIEIYNPLSFLRSYINQDNTDKQPLFIAGNVIGMPARYLESTILGSHMSKESAFDPSFRQITTPIQIFLTNPQAKGFIPSSDIVQIIQNMSPDTKLFVHAPYIINLCADDTWPVERLRHELLACQQLGGKGVVVHVGKYKDQNIETALDNMEGSVRNTLEVATDQCPLLIETPAGEGTELCSGLTQFQKFYNRFRGATNFKICVDTCHIFAAGYDPEYYINSWITKYPNAVALVHFNDSANPRGSRVDRHHPPGLGYIGYKRLWKVHELCRQHNIPMVRE
jgi:deoxyribonuclease IV